MRARALAAVAAWLLMGAPGSALGSDVAAVAADIPGPAWFQDNAIFYQDFSQGADRPRLNSADLRITGGEAAAVRAGFLGQAWSLEATELVLSGPMLSPHRPLTISLWWSLPRDLPITGGFGLAALTGTGFISSFVSGKGEWCALQRPAGVLQMQRLAGIQDVNHLYDLDIAAHVDLRANVWHHTALVIAQASTAKLIIDGRLVGEATASGRFFTIGDELVNLRCGRGIIIDELCVLARAIDVALIPDYVAGLRRIAEYRRMPAQSAERR
ncbi:MAG: hypothetical protein H0V44_06170 [Planctomycetes bacterium]|nr:hypothetical protein [Planctomycetota bacterium]